MCLSDGHFMQIWKTNLQIAILNVRNPIAYKISHSCYIFARFAISLANNNDKLATTQHNVF